MISGATLIFPAAIHSIACGYSPAEAQEPCSRIWRVTTFCSGIDTSGEMLPTSATVPPLRVQSIAAATVSGRPTASKTTSTPRPPVSCSMRDLSESPELSITASAPKRPRQFEPRGIDVSDKDAGTTGSPCRLQDKQTDHACADDQRRLAVRYFSDTHRVDGNGDRFEHRSIGEREVIRQAIENAFRNSYVFSKCSGPAVIAAGDPHDLAIVAEIDFPALGRTRIRRSKRWSRR